MLQTTMNKYEKNYAVRVRVRVSYLFISQNKITCKTSRQ